MRRVTSVPGKLPGVALAAAIACILPIAAAQQTGPANSYNQNSSAPSAPRFVSTFGPSSVVVPGRGSVRLPGAGGVPDYASSWGIAHQTGHERDRDRRRSGRHGYVGVPIYNSWALMPWDYGYLDSNGYPGEEPGTATGESVAQPGDYAPAPPDEHRPAYPVVEKQTPTASVEREVAPPPPPAEPAAAPAAATPSATALAGEPTLTLVFKDGHRQSVRNYAVTGSSVIVLDNAASGRQQRIPLADLNVPATEQAAEAAGLDFSPPR